MSGKPKIAQHSALRDQGSPITGNFLPPFDKTRIEIRESKYGPSHRSSTPGATAADKKAICHKQKAACFINTLTADEIKKEEMLVPQYSGDLACGVVA